MFESEFSSRNYAMQNIKWKTATQGNKTIFVVFRAYSHSMTTKIHHQRHGMLVDLRSRNMGFLFVENFPGIESREVFIHLYFFLISYGRHNHPIIWSWPEWMFCYHAVDIRLGVDFLDTLVSFLHVARYLICNKNAPQ